VLGDEAVGSPPDLISAPILSTFLQAPLRSRKAGFPRSGSDLGLSLLSLPRRGVAQAPARIHPAPRWFAQQLVPASWFGVPPAPCPGAHQGPPSAQSRFASGRCYRREKGMVCLLEGRYPFVVARTGSCARPVALLPASASPRSVGLCRLLPAPAGHRPFPTLSLPILPHVSGPLLRLLPGCTRPLLPPGLWPSPR